MHVEERGRTGVPNSDDGYQTCVDNAVDVLALNGGAARR